MELIFVCPETFKTFYSRNFEITRNRGVCFDDAGNKTLDAQVTLSDPCPFCGNRHSYRADELSCPLAAPVDIKTK